MAIFFSSVFLMLASPMILISFVVRRRTTSSPDTIGAVTIPENIDTFTRGRGIIRTAGKICCLFCLFTVLTFFMAYARLQITRTGFFSTLATKSALELNCLQIVADYRPKDFIGIYGDMTGQYHREIDSLSTLSQALFDQGMLHTYGFNTVEGIRNFEACLEEDPTCAMCHWGVAYANGPNINTDVSNAMAVAGRKSIQIALKLMNSKSYENTITIKKLSEENKALIMAQEKEFSFKSIEEWVEKKQQFYDLQYMESMKESLIAFPEDIDIAVMYAESIMNLSPWQYYVGAVDKVSIQYDAHKPRKTKQLLDNMKLALDVLKNAILRSPFHPLALHLWIHVTESSSDPSHGEKEADALVALAHTGTGTSHLLHMPAHIYLRTGRYQDAVSASVIAIRSDRLYEEKCLVPYVPLHNIAMLVSASLFCGNFIQALKYSPYSSLSLPEASAIHLPALIPTPKDVIMTRMGRWTDILSIFADNSEIKNNSLSTRNPRAIKFIKYASINKDKSELFIERERGKRKSLRSNTNQIGNEKGMNLDSINRKTFGTSTDSPYVRAMQAYSQTLAYSGTGDLRRAGNFLDILSESVKSIPYDNLPLDHPFYPYHHEISEILLLIARSSLILKENINRGESLDSSILLMKEAVGLQDSFSYMEPESFHFPVRHCLGALLIERSKLEIQEKVTTLQGQGEEQGQRQRQRGGATGAQLDSDTELLVVAGLELESAVGHTVSLLEAIDVYRTDLEDHPRNIWSLRGLLLAYQSLQQIRLRNTTESVTQTKEQTMMAVKREEEKDDGELFVHIATLKAIERDAFASTDHDYMKITGSCCELSLC